MDGRHTSAERPEPEEWPPSEDRLRPVHLLRGVTLELDQFGAEFAQRNNLHPTDLRALVCILDAARAGTTATPGWLGAELSLNSAGTTSLLDRLERLGYVRRTRDDRDRRRVLLTVEERAVALGWSFFGPLIRQVLDVVDTFDDGEAAVVERFLREVAEAVADLRRKPG